MYALCSALRPKWVAEDGNIRLEVRLLFSRSVSRTMLAFNWAYNTYMITRAKTPDNLCTQLYTIHTYIHIYIHTYIHLKLKHQSVYIHTYIHTHTYTLEIDTLISLHTYIHTYIQYKHKYNGQKKMQVSACRANSINVFWVRFVHPDCTMIFTPINAAASRNSLQ